MKFWTTLSAFVLLVIATGCGSSGPSTSTSPILNPPAVQAAQSSYSNASITGTYSFSLSSGDAQVLVGSFKADGSGNITGGTAMFNDSAQPCSVSISGGAYSINSDATGTMQIIPVLPCVGEGTVAAQTLKFNVALAQQGDSIFFAGIDQRYAGSAAKQ
jgi:hypothetical protein